MSKTGQLPRLPAGGEFLTVASDDYEDRIAGGASLCSATARSTLSSTNSATWCAA